MGLMTSVQWDAVGSVAVVDLEAACEAYGRELPQPLGRSRPVGSVWLLTRDVGPIEDRLRDGDLRGIRGWVEAVARPEVSVSCRLSYSDEDARDLRLHAMVVDGTARVAVQRTDADGVDTVDIHSLWPGDLGAAVAGAIGLTGPGAQPRIAVTGCGDRLPAPAIEERDEFGFSGMDSGALAVDETEVSGIGAVQIRADSWGETLQWVHVDGDGDYLYAADEGYAEPVDATMLRRTLDDLIGGTEPPTSSDGELSFL